VPEAADADQQLQAAIARLLRHKGRTELPRVRERSGAAFDSADGWTVSQVYLRSRLGRTTDITEVSRRYRLPPAVLEPAFDNAVAHGYVRHEDGRLGLTPAGEREMEKLIAAVRAWLAEELSDWGADDQELAHALAELATEFVEREPELVAGSGGSLLRAD
jgi:hypothetical protein